MRAERRRQIERLVQAALDLEPGRRADFLSERCGTDDALKTEAESLLVVREQAAKLPETATIGGLRLPSESEEFSEGSASDPSISTEARFSGSDRFELERRLGAGAFGVVYAAHDRARAARVALKLLRRADPASLYRFKQEFRALCDLSHHNLVRMYELLREGDQWLFTMELVEGVDFLSYVRDDRGHSSTQDSQSGGTGARSPSQSASTFDLGRLRVAAIQLAEGLRALHKAGKLHRDLKPSNVLVTPEDRVVILDFGLVSETAPKTTLTTAGTPGYMAPEQAAGGIVTAASDWYSVGVMIYEALTGRRPGRKPTALSPSVVVSGVPADLDQLVSELLSTDAKARPTGEEVLSCLQSHQEQQTSRGVESRAASRVFVGRTADLAGLRAALDTASERPTVVLVHGSSGIGKSALVAQFISDLNEHASRAVVLSGRCYVRESVPFKAIDGVVDALAQHLKHLSALEAERLMPRDISALAQLFPVLRQVPSVVYAPRKLENIIDVLERRRRAFTALKELLARMADERPLVLCIDDLHWGDVDSLLPLGEIFRPPDPPTLLLVASYRSDEAATSSLLSGLLPILMELRPAVEVRQMALAELPEDEARELAHDLVMERFPHARELAESVARESGGNPYWITELSRRQSSIPGSGTRLEEAVLARVSELPNEARRLLEIIAVAGGPVEPAVASGGAGLQGEDPGLLAMLCNGHFVRQRGTGELETYHDRVRETLVGSLDPEIVRRYHLQLAFAMEAHGQSRDKETLARHFYEGGDLTRASVYAAEAAATAAQALAFDRAVRLYRLALDQPYMEARARQRLRLHMGDALSNAGRGEEAAQSYMAGAAEATDPAEALELRRRAAEQLLVSGRLDSGISVMNEVLGLVGMKLPKTTYGALAWTAFYRAWLRVRGIRFRQREAGQLAAKDLLRVDACGTVAIGLSGVDPMRGAAFGARCLLLALTAGEPSRVSRALSAEAAFESYMGGGGRRRVDFLFREARRLADLTASPIDRAVAAMMTGIVHFMRGEWRMNTHLRPEWEEWIARARATSDQPGATAWEYSAINFTTYTCLHFLGDFRELTRLIPTALRDASDRGDQYTITTVRNRLLPFVYLAADEPERARHELNEAIGNWSMQGFHLQHYFHAYSRGEVDLYSGNARAAREWLLAKWADFRRAFLTSFEVVAIEAQHFLARAAVSLAADGSHVKENLKAAERHARIIERRRSQWGNALALLIRAGTASVRGQIDRAEDLLAGAEAALEQAGMAHYVAAARWNRSKIAGDSRSTALRQAAEDYYGEHNIKNPERMAAALAPGKWRRLSSR